MFQNGTLGSTPMQELPQTWMFQQYGVYHARRMRRSTVFCCIGMAVVCALNLWHDVRADDPEPLHIVIASIMGVMLLLNLVGAVTAAVVARPVIVARYFNLVFACVGTAELVKGLLLHGMGPQIVVLSARHIASIIVAIAVLFPVVVSPPYILYLGRIGTFGFLVAEIVLLAIMGEGAAACNMGLLVFAGIVIMKRLNLLEACVGEAEMKLAVYRQSEAMVDSIVIEYSPEAGEEDGPTAAPSRMISSRRPAMTPVLSRAVTRRITSGNLPKYMSVPRTPGLASTRPLRILCLDGGGSKGFGASKLLGMLTKRLKKPLWELYDFVAGSSVGGIVLLLHLYAEVHLEGTLPKLIKDFTGFNRKQSYLRLMCTGSTQTKENMREFIAEMAHKAPQDQLLDDNFPGRGLRICITTTRGGSEQGPTETNLIRNYAVDDTWLLRDTLYATAAFPTVVPPFSRNGAVYYDGGLLANNPVIEAVLEAVCVWPGRPVTCVHSIGMSGVKEDSPTSAGPAESLLGNIGSIVGTIGETSRTTRIGHSTVRGMFPEAYFRRAELPLAEYGIFIKDEAEFDGILNDTVEFCNNSPVFEEMIEDLETCLRDDGEMD